MQMPLAHALLQDDWPHAYIHACIHVIHVMHVCLTRAVGPACLAGWLAARCAGSKPFSVIVSKPWLNAVYDARRSDFKLIAWAEDAGILTPPPPLPPTTPAPPAAGAAGLRAAPPAAGAGASHPAAPTPPADTDAGVALRGAAAAPPPPPPSAPAAGGRSVGPAAEVPPGNVAAMLARVNAKMGLSADVCVGRASVMVAEGMLLVPQEVR